MLFPIDRAIIGTNCSFSIILTAIEIDRSRRIAELMWLLEKQNGHLT